MEKQWSPQNINCPFCSSVLKSKQGFRTHITRMHKNQSISENYTSSLVSISTLQDDTPPEQILFPREIIKTVRKGRPKGSLNKKTLLKANTQVLISA